MTSTFAFVRRPTGSLSTFSAPPGSAAGIYPVSIATAELDPLVRRAEWWLEQ